MKRSITVLLLSIGVATAAESPSSLAGTVFHDIGFITSVRRGWERTIIFKSDTEYIYVNTIQTSVVGSRFTVAKTPPDGTYVYTKTGPSTGDLTFRDPLEIIAGVQSPRTLKLEFVDDATDLSGIPRGVLGRGRHDFFGHFALTELSMAEGQSVANVSMRGKVSAENPLVVGFVLKGDLRHFMIRVVGPSLRSFGVSQPWGNPRFELYRGPVRVAGGPGPVHGIAYYEDWSSRAESSGITSELVKLFALTGAFPLELGSTDAVGVSDLIGGGEFTIVCAPEANDPGGEVLVEVYMLP